MLIPTCQVKLEPEMIFHRHNQRVASPSPVSGGAEKMISRRTDTICTHALVPALCSKEVVCQVSSAFMVDAICGQCYPPYLHDWNA
jgi:hypothetical protein